VSHELYKRQERSEQITYLRQHRGGPDGQFTTEEENWLIPCFSHDASLRPRPMQLLELSPYFRDARAKADERHAAGTGAWLPPNLVHTAAAAEAAAGGDAGGGLA